MSKTINQSHNLSQEQMAQRRLDQAGEQAMKQVTGNGKGGEKIDAQEKHLVHARITEPIFGPQGEDYSAEPMIQTFYPKDFEAMAKNPNGPFKGKKVEVIHDGGEPLPEIEDGNKAAIVSPDAPGLSLSKDWASATAAEIKEGYLSIHPNEKNLPSKKEQLAAILEKVSFLNEERRLELEHQEEVRKANA